MASLIPGYEYDIFISYRQKDNKYDGWVTEFVSNLKLELEATFKEEISVYFDINPHDGLLETHDVDESLKEKLKCLVFIPIISRTYCDPKSFAWEHEFKAFVEQASHDQFGLKVKLPNGNVGSRVLPVSIHALDINDIKLCESILRGSVRGIDFIYKSTGVNRPMRATEDHPRDNLNKFYYRDQINKVANTLDDIFRSLKNKDSIPLEEDIGDENYNSRSAISEVKRRFSPFSLTKKTKTIYTLLLGIFTCAVCIILMLHFFNRAEAKKAVAIIPLRCQTNDPELITNGNIFCEAVLTKLHKVKSLTIRPRIFTTQYRNTEKPLNTIRKELNATYIVGGSIRREGDNIMIWVDLSDAKNEKLLWSEKYLWDDNLIPAIVNEITLNIAYGCKAKPSSEELENIANNPTKNSVAYLSYISANVLSDDAWNFFSTGKILLDSVNFINAVKNYDNAIKNDPLFAEAYARRAIARSWGYYTGQFDTTIIAKCYEDINKALEIDEGLPDARIAMGFYYYYCKIDYQKALEHFNAAVVIDPENYQPLFYKALVYRKMGDWEQSQRLISAVILQNPRVALFLTNIGLSYTYLHKFDSALIYHQKAIDIMPEWTAPYVNKIEALILKNGSTKDAKIVVENAIQNTGENFLELRILLDIYDGKYFEALKLVEQSDHNDYEFYGNKFIYIARIHSYLNNPTEATIYYDSALVVLDDDLASKPNDGSLHSALGIACSGKGLKEIAVQEGQQAIALAANNELEKRELQIKLAEIFTMNGDDDNALKSIEELLKNPSCFSIKLLELDPVWKPLYENPEFSPLIEKYSEN